MMRQYQELKRRYPDHLLLFRLGDFYEMFFEDAERGARLFQIALTARQGAKMAGIPHHAADAYIARLVRAGEKVAICEQLEAPGKGKKLLRREVVRVITPGTITDTAFLDGAANNFLLALARSSTELGLALTDVSTGEFWVGEGGPELLDAALLRRPAEVVLPSGLRGDRSLCDRLSQRGAVLTFCAPEMFAPKPAVDALCAHFKVASLDVFGLGGATVGLQAAGGALAYLRETHGGALGHLTRLQRLLGTESMTIDETAVETLELFPTLFGALNETLTPMGARLLRQWMLRPLLDPGVIRARQDAIGGLVLAPAARDGIRRLLGRVGDVERLGSRAAMRVAHARDLVGLRLSLAPFAELRAAIPTGSAPLLAEVAGEIEALEELRTLLEQALVDEPPLVLHEGGLIRPGWSEPLGQLLRGAREARDWIAQLESGERARTGIATLRVRFNRVFGYGIEVSHAQAARVPAEYIRRQTLAGAERYVTAELKEAEAKVLGAEERIRRLDVLAALAEVAHARGHVRPVVDDSGVCSIVDGRHPVLESRADRSVTPNDILLDADATVMILTGPNMSGKSVYLRQTALLAIMAQMGAFVPAREARFGVIDRIFTRVGAQDNVAAGQSTFLVEMVETASILHNVTPRSLVLLDEVGRGTSTYDGLAIAWAVVEALHDRGGGAKVLFATHYHELTQLAVGLPRVRNFHVAVREWNDEIIFLHKVRPGGTDKSYGIHVARLAGVPAPVVERAKALLSELEASRAVQLERADASQLGLFEPAPHPLAIELAKLELSRLTPLDALNILADWQRRI
ncbi:MAG: DNA mismatch repair protein MutS [Candidatus Rokuibacteriota bacterium]|nr:MAG: DNA mismatch repair protein MutS [Candidatus Rokubacteria bacterium]